MNDVRALRGDRKEGAGGAPLYRRGKGQPRGRERSSDSERRVRRNSGKGRGRGQGLQVSRDSLKKNLKEI